MGWVWQDEDGAPSDAVVPHRSSDGGGDRCATRRVEQTRCATEEVEPGRFIRKCEKTKEVLRECLGRPVEVVESNTEHTEEDVTHEMTRGGGRSFTFGPSSGIEPFAFPGLRGDIEAIQRDLLGGMSDFMEAAEAMTNEFFHSFNMRPHHDNHTPPSFNFPKPPVAGPSYKEVPIQGGGGSVDDTYKDLPGEVTDV